MSTDKLHFIFPADIKTVRKAFVLLDQDVPSDEEIFLKLNGKVVDLSALDDEEINKAILGFTLMTVASLFQDK
jgi:hypothetical protein